MKKIVMILGLIVMVLAGSTSASLVINVDLGNGGTYSGQGAYADPGKNFWNGTTTGGTGLLTASDGVTKTGVSISIGNTIGYNITNGTMTNALMKDYRYVNSGNIGTITISGLEANANFLIYVYAAGGGTAADQTASITLNGVTAQTLASIPNPDPEKFVEGRNYVKIATRSDSAGTIAGTFKQNATGKAGCINGFQIVPEPATMAILGLGSVMGLLGRKTRKA